MGKTRSFAFAVPFGSLIVVWTIGGNEYIVRRVWFPYHKFDSASDYTVVTSPLSVHLKLIIEEY